MSFVLMLACLLTTMPLFAQTGTDGITMVSGMTAPHGGIWLAGSAPGSGHFWTPDGVRGFCRVDPIVPTPNPPTAPFQLTNCGTAATSAGQVAVATPSGTAAAGVPAGAKFVFVPNSATKSVQYVRYTFNPATETLAGSTSVNVTNLTAVGGGAGGGRTQAVAVAPNGVDLYVGYSKSGDIMKVVGAAALNGQPPAANITKVGSTSDGRGLQSLLMFNNDLYVAESGGAGLSRIQDPSGITRSPCSAAAVCTAISLNPQISFFPGGLAGDTVNNAIYIGDSPLTTPGSIIRWNLTTNTTSTYSVNVPPYTAGFDGGTRSQYVNPYGLALAPNGDLYVGDDPAAALVVAVVPTAQGHIWRVPAVAPAPVISSISPNAGSVNGGNIVTISGSNFSTSAGGTSISFGGVPATGVSCPTVNRCTATAPALAAGSIPPVSVHVTATVGANTSATSAADTFIYQQLSITAVNPNFGQGGGGYPVTISGTGFDTINPMTLNFFAAGTNPPVLLGQITGLRCQTLTSCTFVMPPGAGLIDLQLNLVDPNTGNTIETSAFSTADQFIYVTVTVSAVSPTTLVASGGSFVTVTGSGFNVAPGATTFNFGPNAASSITCSSTTTCTMISPPGTGTVDVVATVNATPSPTSAADQVTYTSPTATLFAFGITAPKGGMLFIPGALGGHFWASDHVQGFCREDPIALPGGGTLTAINMGITGSGALTPNVCDNGTIGSPGQAVYDPRINPAFTNSTDGSAVPAGTHFIYVPDNAVKSTAVWRLTFNPATETLVGPPEAMVPLANVRTLKPNGMAIGPDGNLYITDLTELNIRQLTNPNGDPRLQTLNIVAVTGDGRGANGTIGFVGAAGDTGTFSDANGTIHQFQNVVVISENRAAAWFDVSGCPSAAGPCATTPIPLPSGAFVAGVATDQLHHLVYASDSPGGANSTIWRYDIANQLAAPQLYLTGGVPPSASLPVQCALSCTRPPDPIQALAPGQQAGFSFTFGIWVNPADSTLYITEDATAGNRGMRGHAWAAPYIP